MPIDHVASVAPRRRGRPRKDARPAGGPSTKELILLAAADAFARRGFDGASLVDIAAAAGVTTGAVYSHFRGKPELLLEIVSSTLADVDPRRRSDDELSPAFLHDWMRWLIAPEQTHVRSLIAEIHHAAMRDPEVRGLLSAYGSEYADVLTTLVRRWQREQRVARDRDAHAVAQLFLTHALGVCTTGAFRPDLLRDETFTELFDRQMSALLGEPAPPRRARRTTASTSPPPTVDAPTAAPARTRTRRREAT